MRSFAVAAFCGLALGIAYLIRQSALVMLVPLTIVALHWARTGRERLLLALSAVAIFVVIVTPDFFYRATVLENVFAASSPESGQLALLDAPRQLVRMLGALFSVTGFGPILVVALLLVFGVKDQKNRFAVWVLGAWIFAFMLFHAPLRLTGVFENNLRYLVPAYPAIALLIAKAMVMLGDRGVVSVRALCNRSASPVRVGMTISGAVVAVILFLVALLAAPAGPERFVARADGWMSVAARRDMDVLESTIARRCCCWGFRPDGGRYDTCTCSAIFFAP